MKRESWQSLTVTVLSVALLLVAAGCSDDNESVTEPPPFQVEITVLDSDGGPVPDLVLGLAPDTPFYQDDKCSRGYMKTDDYVMGDPYPNPFNLHTIIRFSCVEVCSMRIFIEDLDGRQVKLHGDRMIAAGVHEYVWGGTDDAGECVFSGVYRPHLVLYAQDTGDVLFDASRLVLLAQLDAYCPVGTTDVDGRVVLEDKRLFPQLYDLPDFPATDEIFGEMVGTIRLSTNTRFYLRDIDSGDVMRFDRSVDGSTSFTLTWDPVP